MAAGQAQGELTPEFRKAPPGPVRSIAVVGAGLAGLACALAAATAGARVDVYERAAAPALPPAHVDIVPNLLRDLVALGLADACLRAGFVHQGPRVLDAGSGTHFDIETPALAGAGYPAAVGIAYGALARVLGDAARQHGCRLHAGQAVEHIDARSGTLWLAGGGDKQVDLVLLATGIDSPLRSALFGAAEPAAVEQDWWHVLLPRPAGVDRSLWVVAPGGRKAQLVPVSMQQAGLALLRPVSARTDNGAARVASMRAALQGLPAPLAPLAAHLHEHTSVAIRPVRSALLPVPWHRGAALAVGECAHAIAPHFGQPAAQSFEDAVVLAGLLRQPQARETLLAQFTARRSARAAQVHALAAQAARWDLHPGPATDLRRLAGALAGVVAELA